MTLLFLLCCFNLYSIACEKGNLDLVKYLIEKRVDKGGKEGWTPLIHGNVERIN